MRLIAKTYDGNVFDVTKMLNEKCLVQFVFSIQYLFDAVMTIVIFKTDSYPNYIHFCKRIGIEPISTEEYFKMPEEQHE